MNRLYAVESDADVDRRARRSPAAAASRAEIERSRARSPAAVGVGRRGVRRPDSRPPTNWVAAVAKDLQAHRGASLVIAGDAQPPAVHALAHAMNAGARQRRRRRSSTRRPVEAAPVDQLAVAARAGRRHERRQGRPAGHPRRQPGLHRAGRSRSSPTRSTRCRCASTSSLLRRRDVGAVPLAHSGGALPRGVERRARATTARSSIVQPLIAPLYGGKSAHEVLAALSDRPERSAYDIVRELLEQRQRSTADFEATWRRWLHDGVIAGHGVRAEDRSRCSAAALARASRRQRRRRRARDRRSGPIRRSSTAASRTTAGCRSCRSRSPS